VSLTTIGATFLHWYNLLLFWWQRKLFATFAAFSRYAFDNNLEKRYINIYNVNEEGNDFP